MFTPKFDFFVDDNGFQAGRVDCPYMPAMAHPIVVKIVKDSITDGGSRLVTWCWEYPRMIHAEIMTHRILSRNSASSRAIPAASLRRRTVNNPVMPFYWGKNQKGMQAEAELTPAESRWAADWWLQGLAAAVDLHQKGEALGLHKQIVNRVIEPWMTIAVVVSSTDHANLFHLRKHPAAEPHFQCIAGLAWELFHNHLPTYVSVGGWHLPYVDAVGSNPDGSAKPLDIGELQLHGQLLEQAKRISTARCARVSYLTHEGKRDLAEDIRLHDQLATTVDGDEPGHFSPFEHPAQAVGLRQRIGNFEGWKQYRAFFAKQAGPDTSQRCLRCGCWGDRHVINCPRIHE